MNLRESLSHEYGPPVPDPFTPKLVVRMTQRPAWIVASDPIKFHDELQAVERARLEADRTGPSVHVLEVAGAQVVNPAEEVA